MSDKHQQYKCGYCGYFIEMYCNNYFEHECFKEKIQNNVEEDITWNIYADENILTLQATRVENSENVTEVVPIEVRSPVVINDELLISLVYARKPLWDFRTPVQDRHGLKLKRMWVEVTELLGGQLTIDAVKKRWRQLRDDFMRANKKAKTYIPSGSGAVDLPPRPTFKYYEMLKFLADDDHTITVSNINMGPNPSGTESNLSEQSILITTQTTSGTNRKKKRGTAVDLHGLEIEKEIVDILKAPENKPDGVDGFLVLLGEGLRRLPLRNRNKIQIKFLQLLEDEENILSN